MSDTNTAPGPYEHKGAYTAAAPTLPNSELVTYVCVDCDPPQTFQHRDAFEAHGLYLDHIATHDDVIVNSVHEHTPPVGCSCTWMQNGRDQDWDLIAEDPTCPTHTDDEVPD